MVEGLEWLRLGVLDFDVVQLSEVRRHGCEVVRIKPATEAIGGTGEGEGGDEGAGKGESLSMNVSASVSEAGLEARMCMKFMFVRLKTGRD